MRGRSATTETVTDGLRTVGSLVPRGSDYEVFDGAGTYLCKCPSLAEARATLRRHDIDRHALARLEDDGAPA